MKLKNAVIIAILSAACIGGATEAVKFYPGLGEIAVGFNMLCLAISSFVMNKVKPA